MSEFKFGTHVIKSSIVFFQSRLSYAFVNRKPILPGRIFYVYNDCMSVYVHMLLVAMVCACMQYYVYVT